MNFQTLEYFIVLVEEGSIAKTAERVHITQPALTKRFCKLEEELGQELFVRGARKIELTEAGRMIYDRAQIILNMVQKTVEDIKEKELRGKITIAAGETKAFAPIARAMTKLSELAPAVTFEIFSAHEAESCEWIDKGLADFALIIGSPRFSKYQHIKLPYEEEWGLILPPHHRLVQKETIEVTDLVGETILESTQARANRVLSGWFGEYDNRIKHVCEYNLINNALIASRSGLGIIMCIKDITNIGEFVFRPLKPSVHLGVHIIWRKDTVTRPLTKRFLRELQIVLNEEGPTLLN